MRRDRLPNNIGARERCPHAVPGNFRTDQFGTDHIGANIIALVWRCECRARRGLHCHRCERSVLQRDVQRSLCCRVLCRHLHRAHDTGALVTFPHNRVTDHSLAYIRIANHDFPDTRTDRITDDTLADIHIANLHFPHNRVTDHSLAYIRIANHHFTDL